MQYAAITLIAMLVITVVVSWCRRMTRIIVARERAHQDFAITPSPEMLETELGDKEEIMSLMEASMRASGVFRPEKIPELISKLRDGSDRFERVNTQIAFIGEEFLTVEDKRAHGLNTRMKYTKEYIECFHPDRLKSIEPKSFLKNMHLSAFHRVAARKELTNFRKLGFVKQVNILPCGDERDCNEVKKIKNPYPLDNVPDLPLPGCTAPYCRCLYAIATLDTQ